MSELRPVAFPAYPAGSEPELAPGVVRLVGPEVALRYLGPQHLELLSRQLRGNRKQRLSAEARLRVMGVKVLRGA